MCVPALGWLGLQVLWDLAKLKINFSASELLRSGTTTRGLQRKGALGEVGPSMQSPPSYPSLPARLSCHGRIASLP